MKRREKDFSGKKRGNHMQVLQHLSKNHKQSRKERSMRTTISASNAEPSLFRDGLFILFKDCSFFFMLSCLIEAYLKSPRFLLSRELIIVINNKIIFVVSSILRIIKGKNTRVISPQWHFHGFSKVDFNTEKFAHKLREREKERKKEKKRHESKEKLCR